MAVLRNRALRDTKFCFLATVNCLLNRPRP